MNNEAKKLFGMSGGLIGAGRLILLVGPIVLLLLFIIILGIASI